MNEYAIALVALILTFLAPCAAASELRLGVGRCVITPKRDMWLAGYASRKAPSNGKLHDLWAKALAIEDAGGVRAVIVTADLIGISAETAKRTAALAQERLGIPRERLMLTASHTHSGPVTRDNLIDMYGLDEEQARLVDEYTAALPALLMTAIEEAVLDLEPGLLEWGIGHTDFARNRREYTVDGVINRLNPIGPVDHDAPTLVARGMDGSIKAVLFGYACHNTCLDGQQFCGDYAGFAQLSVEERLPGATALFVAGCGGDQNPLPRRSIALAQLYGEMLASAALDVLDGSLAPITGPLRTAYEEIPLALTEPPARAYIEKQLEDGNIYIQRRAKRLLQIIDEGGALPHTYPYPVQVWQFGKSLQITALGGEAVVDYSLRLKRELGRDRHFVIAYANDVCCYIPSLRVLREGGYEGESSMIYYGFHGPWAPTIEQDIMAAVHRLSNRRTLVNLMDRDDIRNRRPLLIAHRGGVIAENAPECSRAALQLAADLGYDMAELDIQPSKDEEPIVFHDDSLSRACGFEGKVANYTAKELMRMRYAGTDEAILHLQQALALCHAENLGVMLDFKTEGSETLFRRVLALLERYELVNATLCINDAPAVREYFAGRIAFRLTEMDLTALESKPDVDLSGRFWFGEASKLSGELVPTLQARGALVIPAVNTFRYNEVTHREDARTDIERLQKAGVDGFQIDSVYQDFFGIGAG